MVSAVALLLSVLSGAAAFQMSGLPRGAMRSASAVATPQMLLDRRSVGNVAAASLTLALSIANPNFVSAAVNPPAVVHGH